MQRASAGLIPAEALWLCVVSNQQSAVGLATDQQKGDSGKCHEQQRDRNRLHCGTGLRELALALVGRGLRLVAGSSHFGVYGVWLEVGLDGLSEASGVEQASGDVVVEVAEAEGDAPEGLEPAVDGLGGAVRAGAGSAPRKPATNGPQGPALPFMAAQGTAAHPARAPPDRAKGELNRWVFQASHSRIPEIVELSKKNQETPPRHPTHHRTGLLQRQARGVRQQDQGHHPHGLRLPPRHQPHRPDHAPMQRTRHPATTTHNLTHKNSRSLKDRYSCRAFWVIPRAWVDWHAVGEILAERCMPAHGNGWPAGKEYDANGSGGA